MNLLSHHRESNAGRQARRGHVSGVVAALRRRRGMTLIELLGVLAIISIFAVVLLRAVLRELDSSYVREETATLKSFASALRNNVTRNGSIPNQINWMTNLALEKGVDVSSVTQNSRQRQRFFLIDTSGWFTNGLPYVQSRTGLSQRPLNARLMIVSSVGGPALPLSSGTLGAADFETLWTNTVYTTGVWAGWNGRPEDVIKELIDLTPLFVQAGFVTTSSATTLGPYQAGDDTNMMYALKSSSPVNAYYLQNTVIRLYDVLSGTTYLDATHVLTDDVSFRFEAGIWKSGSVGSATPGGMDLAGAASSFLRAPYNMQAQNGAAQQKLIVESMINYMSNYVNWSANFADAGLKQNTSFAFTNMLTKVQEIFLKIGTVEHYPVNTTPCP
jgi:prepilin-type N-terminal cleavage/methylation domain-containing protein